MSGRPDPDSSPSFGDRAAADATRGPLATGRYRFNGHILGVGSSSGVRVVVGMWADSPFGAFADAMVEDHRGHRILVAPSAQVAQFVAQTYAFDETRVEPFHAERTPHTLEVVSSSLTLNAVVAVRTRGTARAGRREWYAARDHHRVTSLTGRWDGVDLGRLAPVDPPTRFGFSSTPRTPALTAVTTTIQLEMT